MCEIFTAQMFDDMVQKVEQLVIVDDEIGVELTFDKPDMTCDVSWDSDGMVSLGSKLIKMLLKFDCVTSYSFTPPHRLVLFCDLWL